MSRRQGVMQAGKYNPRKVEQWLKEDGFVYVQPKLKGVRLRWNGEKLWSSEGNRRSTLPTIERQLQKHWPNRPLDGEAYVHGMSEQVIRSIAGNRSAPHPDEAKMQFVVFDIPMANLTQELRHHYLYTGTFSGKIAACRNVKRIFTYRVMSLEGLPNILNKVVADGYEGIIIRRRTSEYITVGKNHMLKWKLEKEMEVTISFAFEGEGKYEGTLGSLAVMDGYGRSFTVGSFKLSDTERDALWARQYEIMGKRAIIKYFDTTDGGVPPSSVFVKLVD